MAPAHIYPIMNYEIAFTLTLIIALVLAFIAGISIYLLTIKIEYKRGNNYFAAPSEDATAITNEVLFRNFAEREYTIQRIKDIKAILSATRRREYDIDAPNKKTDAENIYEAFIEFLENRKEGE